MVFSVKSAILKRILRQCDVEKWLEFTRIITGTSDESI
jgi:hypothetical protein